MAKSRLGLAYHKDPFWLLHLYHFHAQAELGAPKPAHDDSISHPRILQTAARGVEKLAVPGELIPLPGAVAKW